MAIAFRDPFVRRLASDMGNLIAGESVDAAGVQERLFALAAENCPDLAAYWRRTQTGRGVPDTAFKGRPPYLFPDEPPARTFRTSGTSGSATGQAPYSALGLDLMDESIRRQAGARLFAGLDAAAVIRLVPPEAEAPHMVMAHGMEVIARAFGRPGVSASIVGAGGVDRDRLASLLDAAVAESAPAVLVGGSFAFVNVCDALLASGRSWVLPAGSRVIDAGGFKGRSRTVTMTELHRLIGRTFGIPADRCVNLFGMTELASQLYDASDAAVGPGGERPKGGSRVIEPRVLCPRTLNPLAEGEGLLEVIDRAILDRPCVVLSGDIGRACAAGVAVLGRARGQQNRGCSLTLDALTLGEVAHA